MAKKLTKSQLTSKKREDVLAMLTEYLADLGEDVMREGGNSLVFPSTDDEGNELFVKIAVSIPRGDRSGEAYDGYAAAEDYKIHLEEVAANKAQREKENAAKAAKAKERREAAQAKKEAEAAKRAEFLAKQTALGPTRKFIAELNPGDRFAYGQQDGVILSKNDETKMAQIQFDYEDEPSQLRYVAEVFV